MRGQVYVQVNENDDDWSPEAFSEPSKEGLGESDVIDKDGPDDEEHPWPHVVLL